MAYTQSRILLVDDHENLLKTMALLLRHKGYHVETATDGQKAVELVEKNGFDIVFMDLKMPVMDGIQAFKEIRRISPDISVTMMTAYAVEDMIDEALREGASAVLYKPLDIDEVVRTIEKATKLRKKAFVLIVDDDDATCRTLAKVLSRRNFKVATTRDGETAVEMAKQQEPDVMLIDMKLPCANGLQTYLEIKEIQPEATAILITAYRHEMGDLVKQALENTVFACLEKPLNITELLTLIDRIMERKTDNGRNHGETESE